MAEDPAGQPQPRAGIAVAIVIDDERLAQRVAAVLREMPELDLLSPKEPEIEHPEIIVMDRAPAGEEERPGSAVVCLLDRAESAAALRAGAAAVLPRTAGSAELRLAVEAVLHGLLVAPAGSFAPLEREEEFGDGGRIEEGRAVLTAREWEVLRLMAEGASNKQIARRLGVSVHTAKFHVASILEKLDAVGRTDAVAHAVRLGLLLL